MMEMLALNNRKGEVTRQVQNLSVPQFLGLLDQVTGEAQQFLRVVELSEGEAFESMLEQVLEAFTLKVGDVLGAERASLFLIDEARGEVWSKVAKDGERSLEIRAPIGTGIVGTVAASGQVLNIPDAYQDPRFNPLVDRETGYRTRTILGMPILSSRDRVFAVVQLLNKAGGLPFDATDEERLRQFSISIGVILESWWRLSHRRASPSAGAGGPH
jgi:adenylate cyclase